MKRLQISITTFLRLLSIFVISILLFHYSVYNSKLRPNFSRHSISKHEIKRTTNNKTFEGQALELDKINRNNYKYYQPPDWFSAFEKIEGSREFIPKKILIFDTFEWWNSFNGSLTNCPVSQLNSLCEFTEDTQDMINADSVIVTRDMYHEDELQIPLENSDIKVIYFTLETPQVTNIKVTEGTFLASFWRGSDFWVPYYNWKHQPIDNSSEVDDNIDNQSNKINYARGKTKLAATVVSNCLVPNHRNFYIIELQKFLQVDVYGNCGDLSCLYDVEDRDLCFQDMSKDYKFYLSFENANCRDYITEKLFHNALKFGMIPIVLGAHRKDYEALAPKSSYIHVEDFKSPEDLANYLQLVDKNDTMLNEYFQWKKTGRIIPTNFFCEVCAMLHYSDYFPVKSRLGKDFLWNRDNEEICLKTGEWYWDRL